MQIFQLDIILRILNVNHRPIPFMVKKLALQKFKKILWS